jgi:hypothetical protein
MIQRMFTLTKIERLKLVGLCIKAATGIVGGSLILSEGHPYWSISILAIGGVANEIVSFIKEKENAQILEDAKTSNEGA